MCIDFPNHITIIPGYGDKQPIYSVYASWRRVLVNAVVQTALESGSDSSKE